LEERKIFSLCGCNIRLLSDEDEPELQDLCERCTDYSELIEGRPPEKDAGRCILFDLPPDKLPEDKFVFGVYKKCGDLIAVIDLVRDYKKPGEWTIGLLMIDPPERGRGLGRNLHDFVKALVLEHSGVVLRIGVIEANRDGYRFWREMGYKETGRAKRIFGEKEQTVIVMNLSLG